MSQLIQPQMRMQVRLDGRLRLRMKVRLDGQRQLYGPVTDLLLRCQFSVFCGVFLSPSSFDIFKPGAVDMVFVLHNLRAFCVIMPQGFCL